MLVSFEALRDLWTRFWDQWRDRDVLALAVVWSGGLPPLTGEPEADAVMIELYYQRFQEF